eukprot:Nk52_evm79s1737 gene=Nk52_evmTU79s1737
MTLENELVTVTLAEHVPNDFKELATTSWKVWDSETHPQDPPGSGKFHFDYSDNHEERVYIIEGKAELTPDEPGAPVVTIEKGNKVVFHRGFACTWHVLEPMKKHYCYYDEEGNVTQPANISCDKCGCDAWEESYFFEDKSGKGEDEDLCPTCYKKATKKYKAKFKPAEYQKHGEPAADVAKGSAKKETKQGEEKVKKGTKRSADSDEGKKKTAKSK